MRFPNHLPAVFSSTMSREELDHYWSLALKRIQREGAIDLIRQGALVVRRSGDPGHLTVLLSILQKEGSDLSRHHLMLLRNVSYMRESVAAQATNGGM